jgi:hypothetical protein
MVSTTEVSVSCVPWMCNTCLFASFTVIFYVFIGATKFRYVTLKTPREMTREEYERLPAKNNWMPRLYSGPLLFWMTAIHLLHWFTLFYV